jgi:RimJ/RimL family protein N-acetyltransferase
MPELSAENSTSMKIHARTERLILREWDASDLDAFAEIISDPEVMTHIGNGEVRPRSSAEEFIQRVLEHQSTRGWTRFAVEHVESGDLMGFSGLDDKIGRIDFGWRLAKRFWGVGYGYEASAVALWVAQNTFSLTHITSQSYPENVGSVRIIEKLGMVRIGETEEFSKVVHIYGFESEWPDGLTQ